MTVPSRPLDDPDDPVLGFHRVGGAASRGPERRARPSIRRAFPAALQASTRSCRRGLIVTVLRDQCVDDLARRGDRVDLVHDLGNAAPEQGLADDGELGPRGGVLVPADPVQQGRRPPRCSRSR